MLRWLLIAGLLTVAVTARADMTLLGVGGSLGAGVSSGITLLQHDNSNTGGGTNITHTSSVMHGTTAGNVIIVDIGWCHQGNCASGTAAVISSVTSSNSGSGETCQQVAGAQNTNSTATDIWYCLNIVGGTDTITCTAASAVDFLSCDISEWSGISNSSPSEIGNTATGVGTSLSATTNGNASQNGELIISRFFIACACVLSSSQTTINSGNGVEDAYQKTNASGGTWTNSATSPTSNNWSVSIAGFKHP